MQIKQPMDGLVAKNGQIVDNEGYFTKQSLPFVANGFKGGLSAADLLKINSLIVNEYIDEYKGVSA